MPVCRVSRLTFWDFGFFGSRILGSERRYSITGAIAHVQAKALPLSAMLMACRVGSTMERLSGAGRGNAPVDVFDCKGIRC